MKPIVENMLISLCVGLISGATYLQGIPDTVDISTRQWIYAGVLFVIAFSGSVVYGIRQKTKDPNA